MVYDPFAGQAQRAAEAHYAEQMGLSSPGVSRVRVTSNGDVPRPTGGRIAKQLGFNSPYFQNGKFRKPTQQNLIEEIGIECKLAGHIDVVRIEDEPAFTRHVCTVKPYFHTLPRNEYPVSLPEYDIVVYFYVHHECGRLIVSSGSLS